MNELITIIIPVYKVEHCISKCIDSVISQTYSNWELILIDDGSPDESGTICDQYAEKDARIKVLHVDNGGPSKARNVGLDVATGVYVCFIDSDDWVEPTYLEHLYSGLQKKGIGIVIGGHIKENGESHYLKVAGTESYDATNMRQIFTDKQLVHWGYTVSKLYKLCVLKQHSLKFHPEIRYCEDLLFFLSYLYYVDWAKFIPELDYHYIAPVSGSSLIISYNSFESEYIAYKQCLDALNRIALKFSASEKELELSYNWMSYMLTRSIKTIYRPGMNYFPFKQRYLTLLLIPKEDIVFASNHNANLIFIDKLVLFCLRNDCCGLANIILSVFFYLRYKLR